MAVSACLLFDDRSDRAVRRLWRRLEDQGVSSLLSHTHGHHHPHLTLASLLQHDLDRVRTSLAAHRTEPIALRLEGLGMFRRSRCWLAPAVSAALVSLQRGVAGAAEGAGAVLYRSCRPEVWVPHVTLAPRLHLQDLTVVARTSFEVLPIDVTLEQLVLIDTATGSVHPV